MEPSTIPKLEKAVSDITFDFNLVLEIVDGYTCTGTFFPGKYFSVSHFLTGKS